MFEAFFDTILYHKMNYPLEKIAIALLYRIVCRQDFF
jgi:hypothetical protein